MFHLDAGWFREVGDWHADTAKFPHGIASIADFAHAHGLKFGLWIDWTQAGTSSEPGALSVNDSADARLADRRSRRPAGSTASRSRASRSTWDCPPAARLDASGSSNGWSASTTSTCSSTTAISWRRAARAPSTRLHRRTPRRARIYEDSGFLWVERLNSTDVSYHATRAYYESTSGCARAIRSCCWRSATTAAAWWTSAAPRTATTSPSLTPTIRSPTAARSTTRAMCCRRRCWRATWPSGPAPRIETFRYMLRSGMMGWFSLMLDTSRWTAAEHADARVQFELYKSAIASADPRRRSVPRVERARMACTGTASSTTPPRSGAACCTRFAAPRRMSRPTRFRCAALTPGAATRSSSKTGLRHFRAR